MKATVKGALKVFGGVGMGPRSQTRRIVATTSQKKAAELVGWSLHSFRQYWTETGNEVEVQVATATPGVVFCRPLDSYHAPFVPEKNRGDNS